VEKESTRATGIGLKQEERTCMVVGALEGILKWYFVHEPLQKAYFFVLRKLGTCTFRRIF
jgi:hypothetical protein